MAFGDSIRLKLHIVSIQSALSSPSFGKRYCREFGHVKVPLEAVEVSTRKGVNQPEQLHHTLVPVLQNFLQMAAVRRNKKPIGMSEDRLHCAQLPLIPNGTSSYHLPPGKLASLYRCSLYHYTKSKRQRFLVQAALFRFTTVNARCFQHQKVHTGWEYRRRCRKLHCSHGSLCSILASSSSASGSTRVFRSTNKFCSRLGSQAKEHKEDRGNQAEPGKDLDHRRLIGVRDCLTRHSYSIEKITGPSQAKIFA